MVADCRSRLSIRPHAGRAVLFYSQHPNGEEDTSSLHGGCPVLSGVKWAVSLNCLLNLSLQSWVNPNIFEI
jgi:hypothetical protein